MSPESLRQVLFIVGILSIFSALAGNTTLLCIAMAAMLVCLIIIFVTPTKPPQN